jgi:hypothetical protein
MLRFSRDHAIAVADELENEIFGANETEGERIGEAAAVLRSLADDREILIDRTSQLEAVAERLNIERNTAYTARTFKEWTPEHGPAFWFQWPMDGRMWCGSPLDADYPGAYTYWLPMPKPESIYMPVTRGM